MGKIPKQRGGGMFGGSGHGESKFTSVRRGGRPSAGRKKPSPCLFTLLAVSGALVVLSGFAVAVGQKWLT